MDPAFRTGALRCNALAVFVYHDKVAAVAFGQQATGCPLGGHDGSAVQHGIRARVAVAWTMHDAITCVFHLRVSFLMRAASHWATRSLSDCLRIGSFLK